MMIAQQLKEKNIAEYLLYMWQIEDLIRASGCDMDTLQRQVVQQMPLNQQAEAAEWLANLVEMMRIEGVREKGHLQINRNVLQNLTELHAALLASTKFPFYNAAYFKALPFVVELRRKNGSTEETELETCFQALYGLLLLRLQKKEISAGTTQAMEAISHFISLLANYYDKEQKGELKELYE